MSAVHPSGRSSRAAHVVVLASLLLAACEGGDLLDQRPLVGEWRGRLDDGTHYAMTLQPEGDGATTVISRIGPDGLVAPNGDTTRFEIWWYGHDDDTADSTTGGSTAIASDSAAASTVPTLCLIRDEEPIRCHVEHAVHALRADTLDIVAEGGRRLRLLRVGGERAAERVGRGGERVQRARPSVHGAQADAEGEQVQHGE